MAAAMGVAQPRVSAIERGQINSAELDTLRSYVEALGGRLRLVADFGDETITVSSCSDALRTRSREASDLTAPSAYPGSPDAHR